MLDAGEIERIVEVHYDDVLAYCRRHALARRVSAQAALPAMAVWTALVMAAAIALYGLTRTAYEAASVGAWALVAAVAAVLALREARRWLDQAAAGLDCLGAAKVHG